MCVWGGGGGGGPATAQTQEPGKALLADDWLQAGGSSGLASEARKARVGVVLPGTSGMRVLVWGPDMQ